MISDQGMRDLVVGQKVTDEFGTYVVVEINKIDIAIGPVRTFSSWSIPTFANTFSLALPEPRISRGFYRHRAGGPDDIYFVHSVAILDKDGHGNPDSPRQVCYDSTRSATSGLINLRSEAEFGQLVTGWPDGVIRPRFVRIEHSK
jgi:hypothetical protein